MHIAGHSVEALDAIQEADTLVERFENRYWSAELRRLRGVFLTAMGVDEAQIEASFCEAIKIRAQKNVQTQQTVDYRPFALVWSPT